MLILVNGNAYLYVIASNVPISFWYNLHELLQEGYFWTLTSFVALGMRSEGNAPKKADPTVGFPFTIILKHTGRF
jgi:hypothetical protein